MAASPCGWRRITDMRITILDSFTADQGDTEAWFDLPALGEVTFHPRTPASATIERCREAEAVITNKVVLDAAVIASLPHLRYVGVTATGTNVVDVAAARSRGIAVT